MRLQGPEFILQRRVVAALGWAENAVPWLGFSRQRQDQSAAQISRFASEHRFADVIRPVGKRFDNPGQRVRPQVFILARVG